MQEKKLPIYTIVIVFGWLLCAHVVQGAESAHVENLANIKKAEELCNTRFFVASLTVASSVLVGGCLVAKRDALSAPACKSLATVAATGTLATLYRLGTAHYHLDAHIKKENAREAEALRRHAFRSTDF